jgi:hypothetical protein
MSQHLGAGSGAGVKIRDKSMFSLLGRLDVIPDLQQLSTSNHLVDSTNTKLGHNGTELIGDVVEEVDNMLGSPLELFAQLRVLCSDSDGARAISKC